MFHDPLGDFGGSYDPALGDPRGGHGVEFGGRGGPRTAGGAGAVFGPDPLLEDERRYYSSDSVPMHSESYPMQPTQQQSYNSPQGLYSEDAIKKEAARG